jgi:hypothetical protein
LRSNQLKQFASRIADITDPALIDHILSHIQQSRAPPAKATRHSLTTTVSQQPPTPLITGRSRTRNPIPFRTRSTARHDRHPPPDPYAFNPRAASCQCGTTHPAITAALDASDYFRPCTNCRFVLFAYLRLGVN